MEEKRIYNQNVARFVECADHTSDERIGEIHFDDRLQQAAKCVQESGGATSGKRSQGRIDEIIICQASSADSLAF